MGLIRSVHHHQFHHFSLQSLCPTFTTLVAFNAIVLPGRCLNPWGLQHWRDLNPWGFQPRGEWGRDPAESVDETMIARHRSEWAAILLNPRMNRQKESHQPDSQPNTPYSTDLGSGLLGDHISKESHLILMNPTLLSGYTMALARAFDVDREAAQIPNSKDARI